MVDVPMPQRIARLPKDSQGSVIPWFVQRRDNEHQEASFDPTKFSRAISHKLCWLCGEPLGRNMSFVAGPSHVVTRLSTLPPCHCECALYSVRAGSVAVDSALGVVVVWTTRAYKVNQVDNGYMIEMGMSTSVDWYREGRTATPAEAAEAFILGAARLLSAAQQRGGPDGVKKLCSMIGIAAPCLPDPSLIVGAQIDSEGGVVQP